MDRENHNQQQQYRPGLSVAIWLLISISLWAVVFLLFGIL